MSAQGLSSVQLLLLDLGGVVCEFIHDRRLAALARLSGLASEQVHARLFQSGFDLDCDLGRYSLDQLHTELCARLGIRASLRELSACWAAAFSPNPRVLELVAAVRSRAATGILTNNGPLVEVMLREHFPELVARFDQLCFSYQVQATKPDRRAYLGALERLGVAPARCVFVDDADQNVQGARAVGIDAVRFTSADALASALRERGLLDQG
jgi:putative hydrolase of the HAD superfamily